MPGSNDHVRVAVVQAGSLIMNRGGTVDKAISLTAQASKGGAKIVLFPEAFVGGYPWGMMMGTAIGGRTAQGRQDWARYWENSVPVPSRSTDALGEAARKAGVYLVMGIVERSETNTGTL